MIAPHRDFGIAITLEPGEQSGPEPVGQRNPASSTGSAIWSRTPSTSRKSNVTRALALERRRWSRSTITDDGPGFPPDIIDRIGEPYMSTRQGAEPGGGLGLGLFIAKTLLERSGASISFRNSQERGEGAVVEIVWPRAAFVRRRRRFPKARSADAAAEPTVGNCARFGDICPARHCEAQETTDDGRSGNARRERSWAATTRC